MESQGPKREQPGRNGVGAHTRSSIVGTTAGSPRRQHPTHAQGVGATTSTRGGGATTAANPKRLRGNSIRR
jgi:hypothetical protein